MAEIHRDNVKDKFNILQNCPRFDNSDSTKERQTMNRFFTISKIRENYKTNYKPLVYLISGIQKPLFIQNLSSKADHYRIKIMLSDNVMNYKIDVKSHLIKGVYFQ